MNFLFSMNSYIGKDISTRVSLLTERTQMYILLLDDEANQDRSKVCFLEKEIVDCSVIFSVFVESRIFRS